MRKAYFAVLVLAVALAGALLVPPATSAQNTGWHFYGGDPGNTHWSALNQINTSNVQKLKASWVLQLGTLRSQESTGSSSGTPCTSPRRSAPSTSSRSTPGRASSAGDTTARSRPTWIPTAAATSTTAAARTRTASCSSACSMAG